MNDKQENYSQQCGDEGLEEVIIHSIYFVGDDEDEDEWTPLEEDPAVLAEIDASKDAYKQGDYMSIEQYLEYKKEGV